jgi:hypothetical protein
MRIAILVLALASLASGRALDPQTPLHVAGSSTAAEEVKRPRPSRFATTITPSPDYEPLMCVVEALTGLMDGIHPSCFVYGAAGVSFLALAGRSNLLSLGVSGSILTDCLQYIHHAACCLSLQQEPAAPHPSVC